MLGLLKWNGILFDDYGYCADGGKGNFWSAVSKNDVREYGIDRKYLDENAGHGICGIQGHEEEADYYIDFPMNEIEFVEE